MHLNFFLFFLVPAKICEEIPTITVFLPIRPGGARINQHDGGTSDGLEIKEEESSLRFDVETTYDDDVIAYDDDVIAYDDDVIAYYDL